MGREEKEYKHYTYDCQPSSETRGRYSLREGKPRTIPCGKLHTLRTARKVTLESDHQVRPPCGNRKRLNPGLVEEHHTWEDAENHKAKTNRERGF